MKVTIDNKQVELTTLGNEQEPVWVEKGTTNVLGKVTELKDRVVYDYQEERIILGEAILNARKAKGYTMDRICELTGLSKASINGYEKGKISPNVDSLLRLEYFLDTHFLRI